MTDSVKQEKAKEWRVVVYLSNGAVITSDYLPEPDIDLDSIMSLGQKNLHNIHFPVGGSVCVVGTKHVCALHVQGKLLDDGVQ